jgi:hypothetical protein
MGDGEAAMSGPEVVLTVDVEWAHPDVLADVVQALDERSLRATFFCTHGGISVPGHERALHPNFRRHGNTTLDGAAPAGAETDADFYRQVVQGVRGYCPEAVGVRAHSLFFDSDLLPVYSEAGLEYDSSLFLPLAPELRPVPKGRGILELPLYYMDHWDLSEQATGFELPSLRLDAPGLKVLAFHPNLVYLNASRERHYADAKERYHDPAWLRRRRKRGPGVRTLFNELLDRLADQPAPPTLADVNERWRRAASGGEGGAAPKAGARRGAR